MGRRKARARRPAAAVTADGSDDELIRGDLNEDELRDELDEFELSRERALLGAGGTEGGPVEAPPGRRRAPAQVLAFDDDDSASDGEYGEPPMGTADGEEHMDDTGDTDTHSGGWGRRKSSYYSADHVDEDWRGATREETLEAAELEEREARAVQRRLAQELERHQLEFGAATVRPAAESETAASASEAVPLDTSGLSRAERLDLLRRQCPELLPLVDEFRSRGAELAVVLDPACRLVREGRVAAGPAADYITVRRRLLMVYCLNISHYLTLRARRQATDSHPVMRRIAQFGKLLQTLAPADRTMAPQLDTLCQLVKDGAELETLTTDADTPRSEAVGGGKRRLRVVRRKPEPAAESAVDRELAALTMEIDTLEREKRRLAAEKEAAGPTFTELRQAGQARHNPLTPFRRKDRPADKQSDAGGPTPADPDPDLDLDPDPDQKRSITYQMAKNKGLMPKRSRESRNPRVKHKEKFKRAVKKRRSLVRQPKKELKKYGGEVFGIRMGAVKSVPIK